MATKPIEKVKKIPEKVKAGNKLVEESKKIPETPKSAPNLIDEGKKILGKVKAGIKAVEDSRKVPEKPKMAPIPIEERKKILQEEILKYVKGGWQITSQFDTSAQLTRHTGPSCLVAFILAFLLLFPAILYMLFYKGDETVYIEVDEQGQVKITET